MLIRFRVGDPSADPFPVFYDYLIEAKYENGDTPSLEDIVKAYYRGVEIVGFSIEDTVIESNIITKEQAKAIKGLGVKIGTNPYILKDKAYVQAYIALVKKGCPELEIELLDLPIIEIGGEGLYI